MPQGTKIATCCYCGTRAALILTGKTRHELSCQGCGAPLHDLKMMPGPRAEVPRQAKVSRTPKAGKRKSATPNPLWEMKRDDSFNSAAYVARELLALAFDPARKADAVSIRLEDETGPR